jgi:hypothetical protein
VQQVGGDVRASRVPRRRHLAGEMEQVRALVVGQSQLASQRGE